MSPWSIRHPPSLSLRFLSPSLAAEQLKANPPHQMLINTLFKGQSKHTPTDFNYPLFFSVTHWPKIHKCIPHYPSPKQTVGKDIDFHNYPPDQMLCCYLFIYFSFFSFVNNWIYFFFVGRWVLQSYGHG